MNAWRWVEREQIEDERWDRTVRSDARSLPYGLTQVLDARCSSWGALIYGDYVAVWPIPYKKIAGFGWSRMPLGIQQLGIFSLDDWRVRFPVGSELEHASVLNALRVLPRWLIWVDVHLHEGYKGFENEDSWNRDGTSWFRMRTRRNVVLPLSKEYSKNYEQFRPQIVRNLKKAQQQTWSVFENDAPDVLISAFEQNQGIRYSGRIPQEFLSVLRQQMHVLLHQRRGMVHTVYGPGNQFHAGAFWWFHGDRIVLYFSAVSEEGRKSHAMTYLINELIMQASGTWSRLDFEGSQEEGLFRFNMGWGGVSLPYIRMQRFRIPWV